MKRAPAGNKTGGASPQRAAASGSMPERTVSPSTARSSRRSRRGRSSRWLGAGRTLPRRKRARAANAPAHLRRRGFGRCKAVQRANLCRTGPGLRHRHGRDCENVRPARHAHPTMSRAAPSRARRMRRRVGALQPLHDARMNHHQTGKQRSREHQPPGRDHRLAEDEESQDHPCRLRWQPRVADPAEQLLRHARRRPAAAARRVWYSARGFTMLG